MALIYDQYGNPARILAAMGGDVITDPRSAVSLASLNAETVIDIAQERSASIDVRGTFSLTLIFEVSFNGTDYFQYPIWNPQIEVYVLNITAAGQFSADVPAGARKARVRSSAWISGSATVAFRAANGVGFLYAKPIPASMLSQTAAVLTAVTLTIPAAGIGLYNYLTGLRISKFNTALLTVAAAPVIATTTGIIGTPSFNFPADAGAQGTIFLNSFEFTNPVKGTAPNTAMTISCPATANVIWRVTAAFYIGA